MNGAMTIADEAGAKAASPVRRMRRSKPMRRWDIGVISGCVSGQWSVVSGQGGPANEDDGLGEPGALRGAVDDDDTTCDGVSLNPGGWPDTSEDVNAGLRHGQIARHAEIRTHRGDCRSRGDVCGSASVGAGQFQGTAVMPPDAGRQPYQHRVCGPDSFREGSVDECFPHQSRAVDAKRGFPAPDVTGADVGAQRHDVSDGQVLPGIAAPRPEQGCQSAKNRQEYHEAQCR